jgi:hypothetical protein
MAWSEIFGCLLKIAVDYSMKATLMQQLFPDFELT